MERSFIVYQGEDETPEFDLTEPTSPVHVIWEEIEAGGRAYRGESVTNSIPIRDQRGETGNEILLPGGLTHVSLSRGSKWEWLENVDTTPVRMAVGRIGTKDYTRGRQKSDRAREVVMQCGDRNEELTDIIVDDWVRPAETDVARVLALLADYLDGSPRATTVIADTYVAAGNTVSMEAKTYDGTDPKGILSEIASFANKEYFVTIDDELWYDTRDSLTYPAGIWISDRPDEEQTEGTCESSTATIEHTFHEIGDVGGDAEAPFIIPAGDQNRAIYVFVRNTSSGTIAVQWQHDGDDPATREDFTKIDAQAVTGGELALWRLINPTPTSDLGVGSFVRITDTAAQEKWYAGWYMTGVDPLDPDEAPVFNTGTGTGSTLTLTGTGVSLNTAGWFANNQTGMTNPTDGGGQTSDGTDFIDRPFGQPDGEMGMGHGSLSPTWTFSSSQAWASGGVVVKGGAVAALVFPPKWDVGAASTEDGLELVSGLRLYYGQDGAYVYVNDAPTAAEYWWAERSFYTSDPKITTAPQATVLAESILDRLRREDRTYNVSIGPLNTEQVGCIKPGQLTYIKARAIPDADDQYQPRRIAQLKWTTPRPGVFWARMQLDRPIKDVPYGVGAKVAHDAIEMHKEGDSHPASAIVVTDADGNFTGTDVEAVLDELFDAIGAGAHTHDDIVTDHGSMGAAEDFDFTDGSDHEGVQNADLTVTLSGATAGEAAWLTLKLEQDVTGGHSLTLPGSVVGASDIEAAWDQTASAVNVLTLFTYDGGTTWYGFLGGSATSSTIWRPVTTYDGTNWMLAVDGDGNAIMTEA